MPKGKLIKVTVHPRAKENKVAKKQEDAYEVWTKMPAKEGWANRATKQLLANKLGISERAVQLVRGGKRRNKIFRIVL